MNFLKNIKKPFVLKSGYNFSGDKEFKKIVNNPKLGKVIVKVDNITMDGVLFSISEIEGIEFLLDDLINIAISQINTSTEKYKKVINKILKAWEKEPEKFKQQQQSSLTKETYVNKGLLSDKEYCTRPYYSVGGVYDGFMDACIITGYGSETYYDAERLKLSLIEVDEWVYKTIKNLKTARGREKFKKAILRGRANLSLTFEELEQWIEIPETIKPDKKQKKVPFPFQIEGSIMNIIMGEVSDDFVEVNEEFVEYIQKESGVDINFLLGWEIAYKSSGEHHHDGQMVEYTLILTSPNGNRYQAHDTHCLVTGWNFRGPVKFTQIF